MIPKKYTTLVNIPSIGESACFKFDTFHMALYVSKYPTVIYKKSPNEIEEKVSKLKKSFGPFTQNLNKKQQKFLDNSQILIITDDKKLNEIDSPKKVIYINEKSKEYYSVLFTFNEQKLPKPIQLKNDLVNDTKHQLETLTLTREGGSPTVTLKVQNSLHTRLRCRVFIYTLGKRKRDGEENTITLPVACGTLPIPVSSTDLLASHEELQEYIDYKYEELLHAVIAGINIPKYNQYLQIGSGHQANVQSEVQEGGYYNNNNNVNRENTDNCTSTEFCNAFHSILSFSDSCHDFGVHIDKSLISENYIHNTEYKTYITTLTNTVKKITIGFLGRTTLTPAEDINMLHLARLDNILNTKKSTSPIVMIKSDNPNPESENPESELLSKTKPWESIFMSKFFYSVFPFEERDKVYNLNVSNPNYIENFKLFLENKPYEGYFYDTSIAKKPSMKIFSISALLDGIKENGIKENTTFAKHWDPSPGNHPDFSDKEIQEFSNVLKKEVLQVCNQIQFISIVRYSSEITDNNTIKYPDGNTQVNYSSNDKSFYVQIEIVDQTTTTFYLKVPSDSFTIRNCTWLYDYIDDEKQVDNTILLGLLSNQSIKKDFLLFIMSLKRSGDHGQSMYLRHLNSSNDPNSKKSFLVTGDSLCAVKALYERQPVLFFKYYSVKNFNEEIDKVDVFFYHPIDSNVCEDYITTHSLQQYIEGYDAENHRESSPKKYTYKTELNASNGIKLIRIEDQGADETNNLKILKTVKLYKDYIHFKNSEIYTKSKMYFNEANNIDNITTKLNEITLELNLTELEELKELEKREELEELEAPQLRRSNRVRILRRNELIHNKVLAKKENNNKLIEVYVKQLNDAVEFGIYHMSNLITYKEYSDKLKLAIPNLVFNDSDNSTMYNIIIKYYNSIKDVFENENENENEKIKDKYTYHNTVNILEQYVVQLKEFYLKT